MDGRLGNRLPIIFAKGQPAKLHDMSLEQLKKFVPFLVKCATKRDLPSLVEDNIPSWWPSDVPFSRSILLERRPQRELVQKLVNIVSRCYQHYRSSYIIAFSASLAVGHQSQGKLSYVELQDGTTRVLNGRQQLVVVIRSSTRHYDTQISSRKMTNRRSARLTGNVRNLPATTNPSGEIAASDFKRTFTLSPRLTRIDEPLPGRSGGMSSSGRSTLNARNVVDDITNLTASGGYVRRNSRNGEPRPKSKKAKKLSKKAKVSEEENNAVEDLGCKCCGKSFADRHCFEDHKDVCGKSVAPGLDIRDDSTKLVCFAASLGLRQSEKPCTPEVVPVQESAVIVGIPDPPVRTLRKVAARSKIGAYIKANPMPMTCFRGQEILAKFGERVAPPPSAHLKYEKHCLSRASRAPLCNPVVSTARKHRIKDCQYTHKYSFGNLERKKRGVELVLGLSMKSFKLFNKCKPVRVKLQRLSAAVVREVQEKEKKRLLGRKGIDIAELVNRCVPFVSLTDVVKYPDSIPQSLKNKVKIQY